MLRSMFAGVSGLKTHQTRLDVIGNNVANVNTHGYKAQRATFQDVFSQTIKGASSPTRTQGGTNPMQVGLGVNLGSIDQIMTQGSVQLTGRGTDLAIDGNGFFIVEDSGGRRYYTRAGIFDRDGEGFLVHQPTGHRVLDANLRHIQLKEGEMAPSQATTEVYLGGNLDANAAVGDTWTISQSIYDSLGRKVDLIIEFEKTSTGASSSTWDWNIIAPEGWSLGTDTSGTLTFNGQGVLTGGAVPTPSNLIAVDSVTGDDNGADDLTFQLNFGVVPGYSTGITQVAGENSIKLESQDGLASGSLSDFVVDDKGMIVALYSNGTRVEKAQVGLALFANPAGLERKGGTLWVESNNSGQANIGRPGQGGRGSIAPSSLEMSNVDIAEEFTNMITTQRGFQANSRIITTSDEVLLELVNMKR